MKKKAFTLIELVVVMAIIAVLSLLIIAAIQAARRSSIESQNRGNARTLEVAMESYASKHAGAYPVFTALTFADVLNDDTTNGDLNDFVNNWNVGSCTNGGGVITSTASTFTLTIYDTSCDTATPVTLDTISH